MTRLLSTALLCIAACTLPACAENPKTSKPTRTAAASAGAAAAATPKVAKADTSYGQRADALRWADTLAQQQGLDVNWLRAQLAEAQRLEQVRRLMTPSTAPKKATARSWAVYRSRFIDPVRIRAGVRFWQENAAALERAAQTYGVPPEIIVGIIGVETIYGRNMGNFRVLDALATLAFDYPPSHPRAAERAAYFQGELAQFLTSALNARQNPSQARGSYAGAMGLGQFMPSSLARFGVDFDGDGKVDLYGSPTDAIGSVANYFRGHGWVPGMPVRYGVAFNPNGADMAALLAPDINPTFTAEQMTQLGAVPLDGGMRHQGPLALVELLNGEDKPSYVIGTQNFYAITRYNQSSYYAMAVYDLGQEVAAALPEPATQPVPAPRGTPEAAVRN